MVVALCAMLVIFAGCATAPPGATYPRKATRALENPESTSLGRRFLAASRENEGKSAYRLIQAGIDGFLIRIQLVHSAEKTLDLQYYIFRADETGKRLTKAVLQAADRGVRVRLLIDDGDTEPGDEILAALASHPSIELRIFNPFAYRGKSKWLRGIEFALNASRLDYRMHNKLLVVDNAVALVGGRNVANEYFQVNPKFQFADEDVVAAGPIAQRLSSSFDEFWNCDLAIPARAIDGGLAKEESLQKLRHMSDRASGEGVTGNGPNEPGGSLTLLASILNSPGSLTWARAEVVADSPDKRLVEKGSRFGTLMAPLVVGRAEEVTSELLVVSPFLIPGKQGMKLLDALRQRRVNVRILTNSLESTSEVLAHAGYMGYRAPMLKKGIELYEIRAHPGEAIGSGTSASMLKAGEFSLHAKLFVFDRTSLFIGSMNFDQRSHSINTEIGLIIDSPALAEQAAKRFEAMTLPENSYRLALRPNPSGVGDQLIWLTQDAKHTVAYDVEPARSEEQRVQAHVLSLIPADGEL